MNRQHALPRTVRPLDVLDALNDGVYVTDTERRILFWNRAAERITGWRSAEVLGRRCSDNVLCHVDKEGRSLCSSDLCPLHRSISTGRRGLVPIVVYGRGRDGRRIPTQVSVAPLREEGGRIVGGVEVFRDMGAQMLDLERSRLIQRHALRNDVPAGGPVTLRTHYVPCDVVGGDFFILHELAPGRVAVFHADVAGHGVSSALFTMFLRVLWEEHEALWDAPAAFLRAVGGQLHTLAREDSAFATAVYLVLDASAGEALWSVAGHPSPLRGRRDGRIEVLEGGGLVLGLEAATEYEEWRQPLDPGDRLLVFSDGATEVYDGNDEALGEEGLRGLLGGLDWPCEPLNFQRLEEGLLDWAGAIHFPDDLSLVELTLQPNSSSC